MSSAQPHEALALAMRRCKQIQEGACVHKYWTYASELRVLGEREGFRFGLELVLFELGVLRERERQVVVEVCHDVRVL